MSTPSRSMPPALRAQLVKAGAVGVLAIASVLGAWYEGDGPSIKEHDGSLLYRVYIDPVGIPTVCRGITGPEVIPGKLYTMSECRVLEDKHARIAERAVRRYIKNYDSLNKWQKAALIDFTYNLGAGALEGSTMRKLFNAGDIEGGCRQLSLWVKGRVRGHLVVMSGLVERRGTELELCSAWGQK